MDHEYDYLFKGIIIGDSGVGKSSLLLRFTDNTYSDSYVSTIGVDFRIKTIIINGQLCKLQLWDTAGQDRFRTITSSYYRGAHAVILVFDVTDVESFQHIHEWITEANKYINKDSSIPMILVGNKSDMSTRRVTYDQGVFLATGLSAVAYNKESIPKNIVTYIETSAKNNEGIDKVFNQMAERLIDIKNNGLFNHTHKNKVDVSTTSAIKIKKSCCP